MVKHDDGGNVIDHKEIANNLWGRYRRSGWEFATQDEQNDFLASAVERAQAAVKAESEKAQPEDKPGDGPLPKKKKATPKEKAETT
jgi:hypothetical protein